MISIFETLVNTVHDEKTDRNSWKYRNDERKRFRREQGCFPRHSSLETSRVAKPHRSIDRPPRSTPPFPPESMLHEFTADSETTRSRNTALQPIFVELPRFVNDKGSNRERYFPSRDQSLHGLSRAGKRFLSSVHHFRFHARKWNKRELDIYIYIYCLIWTEGIGYGEDITFIFGKRQTL